MCAFVPAVITLLMNKYNVAYLQLQLELTVRWIRNDALESVIVEMLMIN